MYKRERQRGGRERERKKEGERKRDVVKVFITQLSWIRFYVSF